MKRTKTTKTKTTTPETLTAARVRALDGCTQCYRHADERPTGDTLIRGLCGACREANAEIAADDAAVKAKRTSTAAEWIQTIPAEILAAAARGDLDLNAIARAELGDRGLNHAGKWVGFEAAKRIAKMHRVTRSDGRRVYVTIPDDDDERPAAATRKPTRDEYQRHALDTFAAGSIHDGRGLVVSVAAAEVDKLIADAAALGLDVVETVTHTHNAEARIFGFRRGGAAVEGGR